MKPMFSGVTVSNHTYNFWTSQTAQYISVNNIKVNNNRHTGQTTHLLEPNNIKSIKK